MSKLKKPALAMSIIVIGIAVSVWWLERPKRIRQAFAAHLYHERYEDAAQMLISPCAIRVDADRNMTIVDHAGATTTVPAERLPFKIGGGNPNYSSDFSMTALQGSRNGLLATPAVTIYLSVERGKIRIASVGS